jgi:sterol 14-demethylase
MNPFKDIYDLVFQMTVRMASCEELAADPRAVQKMGDLYWRLEKSATPASLLLPWLPGIENNKQQISKELNTMLSHYVDVRRKAEVQNSDTIDVLLADDGDNAEIVAVCVTIVVSDFRANDHFLVYLIYDICWCHQHGHDLCVTLVLSGPTAFIMLHNAACWTLLHLGANNEWKNKANAEIQNLIATYTNTMSSEPIHRRLSTIPISAWEDEMPVIESIISEILRLVNNGTLLRRNIADNLQVADKTIEKGAFMAYLMGDVHLNEMFYSEPLKFDPDRFNTPREENKREDTVFLGWGLGRHPCTG